MKFSYNKMHPKDVPSIFRRGFKFQSARGYITKTELRDGRPDIRFRVKDPYVQPLITSNGRVRFSLGTEPAHSNCIVGGILHSGLLKLFRCFGYEYVLDECIKDLQDNLYKASCAKSALDGAAPFFSKYWKLTRVVVPLPRDFEDIYVLSDAHERNAFVTFVPYTNGFGGVALLPGFGPKAHDDYLRFASDGFAGACRLHMEQSREQRLRDPQQKTHGTQQWERALAPSAVRSVFEFSAQHDEFKFTGVTGIPTSLALE
jgi:hypothetical protein